MTVLSLRRPHFTSSWIWLLTLYTVAGFVEVVFWGQMTAFTPLYLPHLGIARGDVASWTGQIIAISSAVGLPLLPLWGALADRYGRQPIIVRSFVAHLLAGALTILAGNVWVFLVARSIQSLSLGNSGLMMTTLAERAPERRLGFAFATMNGAGPIGLFLGPLAGGPIVDAWGFRTLVGIDVVLLLLVLLSLTFGYRDTFVPSSREPILRLAFGAVGLIARSPRLRTLFPALFLLFAGWSLAIAYLPLAVTSLYRGGEPATAIGIVSGVGGLASLLASPLNGFLADRVGHWRALFVMMGIGALLFSLPALAHSLVSFAILWAVLTAAMSGPFSISFNVLSSSVSEEIRGRVMSFAYLPVNLSFAVGPAVGSMITRHGISAIYPAGALITVLGLVVLVIAYRLQP